MQGRALSASIVPIEHGRFVSAPFAIGAATFFACLAVRMTGVDRAGFHFCYFKAFTGYACLTCGSTRAFGYLGRLDFAHAILVQPLATLVALGLMTWGLFDGALLLIGMRSSIELDRRASRLLTIAFVVVAAVNWIYLIATGV